MNGNLNNRRRWTCAIICTCLFINVVMAQHADRDTAEGTPIVVINADFTQGTNKGDQVTLMGNVILRQDSVVIYADTVDLDKTENTARARGEVVIQKNDSVNAFCHQLLYRGNIEYATMVGNVILQNGLQKLFSEDLDFNLRTNVADYDSSAVLTDGVRVISSKQGSYLIDSALVIFVDSVTVAGEDYVLRTDSLHYHVDNKRTVFVSPMRMRQGENDIYARLGFYDLLTNYTELYGDAQFYSPTRRATADTIRYDAKRQDIKLSGNAWYKEEGREVNAQIIDYAESKDRALLIGDVVYQDTSQYAIGDTMTYVISSGAISADGPSTIYRGQQMFQANSVTEYPGTNTFLAEGDVFWQDTVEGIRLRSQTAFIDQGNEEIKAYGEGLALSIQMEDDSLVMTADTLFTKRVLGSDSTVSRQMYAYNHVIGYKSNLQFKSDSAVFDELNNEFRFFGDPVIWSDSSQFTADSIYVYLENDQIDHLLLDQRAFIINQSSATFYNQISGRRINADLKDNALHRAHVQGNAESIYYAVDDQEAYIGVNRLLCSEMIMNVTDNVIQTIRFYTQPTSTFFPISDVDHETFRLENFEWIEQDRPTNVQEMFVIYRRLATSYSETDQTQLHENNE